MLTRVPMPGATAVGTGVRAFPIVGALLGLATLIPLLALGAVTPMAAAILAIASVAILSGGLHLDGLADTFDALVAVGPDATERARRDPAVGAAGATALIVVLGLDVVLLTDILASAGATVAALTCIVAGAVSRLVPVLVARLAGHAAREVGLGAWFVRSVTPRDGVIALAASLLVIVGCSLVGRSPELAFGVAIAGAGSLVATLWLARLRGQLDGDLLGASVEITFAATLLMMAVLIAWQRA
jgi:adenosylcobinamide-GDP ribazoletransferase